MCARKKNEVRIVVEMKLNVADRLMILELLPKEGSFVTLRLIRDMAGKVGLSAEELVEFEIMQKDGMVSWGKKGLEERPFEFKEKEVDLLKSEMEKLDKGSKLEMRYLSLYEKVVEAKV